MTVAVTSAELAADFEGWLGRTGIESLSVTREGAEVADVAVVLSARACAELFDGYGRGTWVRNLDAGEMASILAAEVPEGHAADLDGSSPARASAPSRVPGEDAATSTSG